MAVSHVSFVNFVPASSSSLLASCFLQSRGSLANTKGRLEIRVSDGQQSREIKHRAAARQLKAAERQLFGSLSTERIVNASLPEARPDTSAGVSPHCETTPSPLPSLALPLQGTTTGSTNRSTSRQEQRSMRTRAGGRISADASKAKEGRRRRGGGAGRGRVRAGEKGAEGSRHGVEVEKFDFVIVGSGVAGLWHALAVAEKGTVAVVTKSEPHEGNTSYAQGGVSAVLDPLDSVENHIRDTIVAGAYLCDEEVVEVVCREGPEQIRELMAMGASFDKGEDGQLHLAREGGHSHHRIVHAADVTGREIERALLTAVRRNPRIQMFEHHFAVDLLTKRVGRSDNEDEMVCYGIDALDLQSGQIVRFLAGALLLASGGAGHVYPNTTNPTVSTGDGVALAQRAGAAVSNMEFVQFHPTALADAGLPLKPNPPRANAFLITEAVRGAGGILRNQSGERFMPAYDSREELAPRDVVARSIDDQLKQRGEKFVWLDISHEPREEIIRHFPNIAAECLKCGLDITKQPIPVVPAAHYMCGGVQTGLGGETSIRGLFAAGEVACTGLHGANRLASNSLLEALVFSQRAVAPAIAHSLQYADENFAVDAANEWEVPEVVTPEALQVVKEATAAYRSRLQEVMWDYVGIVRSTSRLLIAQTELALIEAEWREDIALAGLAPKAVTREICEMRNLVSVAQLIIRSALQRQESRGLHYTTDFPQLVESQRLPTVLLFEPGPDVPLITSMTMSLKVAAGGRGKGRRPRARAAAKAETENKVTET
eukprot:TRINITY_DN26222_c0_g1_i1.p1 TRINITY_DN26222_c0_g1~~TRINITY_DN26222_c0_g1_i1.p1  ORF type:complete len:772 (-),score=149.08 TRINITY_DN26222_c0_g1_i1:1060-3375(-)